MDALQRLGSAFRIDGPATQLLPLALLLIAGCSSPADGQTGSPPAGTIGSIADRVGAIQVEAKRIDAAVDKPGPAERARLRTDLPHWEFAGLFRGPQPVFLSAQFSQGRVVREESYYLHAGRLLLVRVEKWWDVDNPSDAPGPKTRQDIYIESDRTIRRVFETASSPPQLRTDEVQRSASPFVERSRAIAKILNGGTGNAATAQSLEALPGDDVTRH